MIATAAGGLKIRSCRAYWRSISEPPRFAPRFIAQPAARPSGNADPLQLADRQRRQRRGGSFGDRAHGGAGDRRRARRGENAGRCRGDGCHLAQPGRHRWAGTARHLGSPVERHAQRGPGPAAARASRRTRHPRAHGMPAPPDLLAGPLPVVRRTRPRTFRRVRRWMSLPAFLQRRWVGRDAESVSQASGTGMFLHDGSAWGWDPELCAACDVTPEQLGPIVDLDDQTRSRPPRSRGAGRSCAARGGFRPRPTARSTMSERAAPPEGGPR